MLLKLSGSTLMEGKSPGIRCEVSLVIVSFQIGTELPQLRCQEKSILGDHAQYELDSVLI